MLQWDKELACNRIPKTGLQSNKVVLGIIPARLASKRLPQKVLRTLLGKPLFYHVYQNISQSPCLSRVYVATDSPQVSHVCEQWGVPYLQTQAHRTGLDRIIEVQRKIPANIYVNVQADEPLVDPCLVAQVVQPLLNGFNGVCTLKHTHKDSPLQPNENQVKVVCNKAQEALYFSRQRIPSRGPYDQHIGIYSYTSNALTQVANRTGSLEIQENLEQLRFLEYGFKIRVLESAKPTFGVDTIEDFEKMQTLLLKGTGGFKEP